MTRGIDGVFKIPTDKPEMNRGVFVTGTDTGVGKTWVSVVLMGLLKNSGLKVAGMKPVASGCYFTDGKLINDDAELLRHHASLRFPYDWVNPYPFKAPIAPHIAANKANVVISLDQIVSSFNQLQQQSDFIVVEGIGGWQVPLNSKHTVADMALVLDLPVILVVGLKMGCLNHAILTYNTMVRSGFHRIGWIANQIDASFEAIIENIDTLEAKLDRSPLAILPHLAEFDMARFMSNFKIKQLNEFIADGLYPYKLG